MPQPAFHGFQAEQTAKNRHPLNSYPHPFYDRDEPIQADSSGCFYESNYLQAHSHDCSSAYGKSLAEGGHVLVMNFPLALNLETRLADLRSETEKPSYNKSSLE
jgi:hypothetical protein